jgi:proteasome accessory factor C
MRDVRPHDDGSAEVDLVVVDRRWLTRLLLRLAPHATVVRPAEFTDTFTARAQETLRLYR